MSGAAASAIKRKFIGLFHQGQSPDQAQFPTPQQVAACDVPFLRQAGLSERKAEYIQGLAERFASGQLSAAKLVYAPDDELMETLTAVRGLGRWSVEVGVSLSLPYKRAKVSSQHILTHTFSFCPEYNRPPAIPLSYHVFPNICFVVLQKLRHTYVDMYENGPIDVCLL